MVANAATPILSLHLLRARLTKEGYAATITATFLFLNVIKFPFSCAIGLIAYPHVSLDACLVPFVLAGIYFGRCLLQTVSGPIFEEVTLVLTLVAGLSLLLPWAS